MVRKSLLTVALVLALGSLASAAKVKVWHQSRPAQFEKGKLKQAVVSNEGTVRLSRQLRPLSGIEASHVWDIVEDKNGNLYVATGSEGKLYKVSAAGKTSVVHTSEDGQILSLCLSADGSVYAGTGPSGRVIRIDEKGQAKIIADGLGSYVWSLAADAKGENIYAGTGPKGRVFRLTPDGKSSVFFTSKQEHILCVAVGEDGQVYAGSDRNGLVYRIDEKGKAFVLYQAPQAEIRSLQVTADGIYVGTSTPAGKRRSGTAGASSSDDVSSVGSKLAAIPVSRDKKIEALPTASSKSSSKDDDKDEKSKSASAPSSPGSGDNSLFRIASDGTVREVFREKTMVMSLLKQPGRFYIGTGTGGQLYEVDEKTKEKTEIARLDHGQILCMTHRADGSIVLGTGDPGKLYVLEDRYSATGTVVSEVFDAKIVSKWGSLRWLGDTPRGTRLTVAVRTGNVADPDETWSDWSVEQEDGDKAQVQAPAARFVQYRLTLSTEDPTKTPSLRSVSLRFATTNQAPEVLKVEVPNLDAEDLDNPKKVKIKWSAEDANEDALTYSLYVKKEGWESWVLLDDDLDKSDFEWDTTTTPSGVYRAKIVANDRKDNPSNETLTGERISDSFTVSHVPPTVSVKVVGIEANQAILEATGSTELVRLTSASFSVNGKKWASVFPADGLFDSRQETFRFKTETLKPGSYVVVLRVKDAAGNMGSSDVVFTVQPKK